MVIIPEWTLQLFMAKFGMNRKEAMTQLKNQDEARMFEDLSEYEL